jgi:hypothetical protein
MKMSQLCIFLYRWCRFFVFGSSVTCVLVKTTNSLLWLWWMVMMMRDFYSVTTLAVRQTTGTSADGGQ